MPSFAIPPSPSPELRIERYDEDRFPQFRRILHPPEAEVYPYWIRANDRAEAGLAIVLENLSKRSVTGLSYRWVSVDDAGFKQRARTARDSYEVPDPVMPPGARMLITPGVNFREDWLDTLSERWGGFGGARSRTSRLDKLVSIELQMEAVVFEDGELVGTAPERYAEELVNRSAAARFLAYQLRRDGQEGLDVKQMLSILATMPYRNGEISDWISRFAYEALQGIEASEPRALTIARFEIMPALPEFYRLDATTGSRKRAEVRPVSFIPDSRLPGS